MGDGAVVHEVQEAGRRGDFVKIVLTALEVRALIAEHVNHKLGLQGSLRKVGTEDVQLPEYYSDNAGGAEVIVDG